MLAPEPCKQIPISRVSCADEVSDAAQLGQPGCGKIPSTERMGFEDWRARLLARFVRFQMHWRKNGCNWNVFGNSPKIFNCLFCRAAATQLRLEFISNLGHSSPSDFIPMDTSVYVWQQPSPATLPIIFTTKYCSPSRLQSARVRLHALS